MNVRITRLNECSTENIHIEFPNYIVIDAYSYFDHTPPRFQIRFNDSRRTRSYRTREGMLRALDKLAPGWGGNRSGRSP